MKTIAFLFLLLSVVIEGQAQPPDASPSAMRLRGTRSWIRVSWNAGNNIQRQQLYWSADSKRPANPGAMLLPGKDRYYIQEVRAGATYHVWLETTDQAGHTSIVEDTVTANRNWEPDPEELSALITNPGSTAVPAGMQLFWQDEFNDELLNRNKWTTNYFSSLNYFNEESRKEMLAGQLPQPAYRLNGQTINLFVNDSLPERLYTKKGNQKISSIQTYDWQTNENLLDNSRGGYFEVKVRRSKTGNPKGLNTAFWFDSPGPDLRYYLEQGTVVDGIKGIRPPGQVFEIDVFELLNAQFVLHGQVDKNGKFVHNLATHIAKGYTHENNWVIHGMLWTPTSIKHYINGHLIAAYTDKHKIYAPNHFMNVFLGTYGSLGNVNMEVDYIRYYQWPLTNGNELPNPGFEDSGSLAPWEGTATLAAAAGRNKTTGLQLTPGQKIEQYLYLSNNTLYTLEYWLQGGTASAGIENVTMVTGDLSPVASQEKRGKRTFAKNHMDFRTGAGQDHHKKTIRLAIENTGNTTIMLDDITIKTRKLR
ncbi:glycoside hydrolase family 16 protein [Niabella drilacis]|uniref:Glycosyl hydrolases family 16 n=1 Tax=Niabella drilacis (strain DSM 25811 / CCM 8410 / CCUG 62505 / LMG 26954 / E90) TaxID=1285928 RepID=A0A1G6QDI4_NIADE|nr:glycoside hydrolase family 16 protein [Niabella drilacis]SDC90363.1 Glycosyl hydrolases family 16 [Niabella drilacis]